MGQIIRGAGYLGGFREDRRGAARLKMCSSVTSRDGELLPKAMRLDAVCSQKGCDTMLTSTRHRAAFSALFTSVTEVTAEH